MLDYFQYQLKGISLLPKLELGAYKQMPYEEINARTYHKMNQSIEPLQFNVIQSTEAKEKAYSFSKLFCPKAERGIPPRHKAIAGETRKEMNDDE
ncbi:hypothetical protein PRIC2_001298 [Phytophthora ramorum]